VDNSVDLIIQFSHDSRAYLERLRAYLICETEGPTCSQKRSLGDPEFGEILRDCETYVMHAFGYANQYGPIPHATRENEFLTAVLGRFPKVTIRGIYTSRFGVGRIFQAEQICEYSGGHQVGTVVDFDLVYPL
jgi:hypothetical protein